MKSCVGSQWCRYGVQDSVALAIALELRYRGLRAPHKIKLGVSGCARECAEARSKDVGVIATEKGWNVYVGGNGGFTPRHAQLFAEDLEHRGPGPHHRPVPHVLRPHRRPAAAHRRLGRGLRGRAWTRSREVVIDDSLGIGADLDAAMAHHVDSYVDEWAATLADPEKRAQFVSFVNAPETPDPAIGGAIDNERPTPSSPDRRWRYADDRRDRRDTWTRGLHPRPADPRARRSPALVGRASRWPCSCSTTEPCTPSATTTRSATPT